MYSLSDFLINQGFSNVQIEKIKKYIDEYYDVSEDSYIHDVKTKQIERTSFLVSMSIEKYDYTRYILEPHTFLLDESGCCTEVEYPIVNYINRELILMTKESDILIENQENSDFYKEYSTIEKQAIMNNSGHILYEGELGDINKALLVDHYLLLEKDKYTKLQKDQIYYYTNNCIPTPYNYSDYMKCPLCGNDAVWDEKENSYICDNCKFQILDNHLSEEEAIAIHQEALHKLAVSDFSEVFNSEEIKHGKYIIDTPEEREEREINKELNKEFLEEEGVNYEQEPDYLEPYLNRKLYSVYDTWRRKLLFPFQPCKISAFPEGMPKGLYLANEEDLKTTYCGFLFESKMKSYPWVSVPDPFGDISLRCMSVYEGPMFFTVFDTFRTGPHTGQSFLQVYRKEASKIEKYILSDHMYMTTELLKELKDIEHINDKNRAFSMLLATRDSKLSFMPIKDIRDEIKGISAYRSDDVLLHMTFQTSWYEKMPFADVFKKDPQYVITLVELNDIHVEQKVLNDLDQYDRIQELRNSLQRRLEKQNDDPDYMREEVERRYYEIEGYQDAFDGDPSAQWNVE